VEEGCVLVQGTINGIGERCGNTNLCSIIPALQLKKNYSCISKNKMLKLAELSRYVYEIANLIPNDSLPYVGKNAFAHKAGVHAGAIEKKTETYEHICPSLVGNKREILISDLSGKSNITSKIREMSAGGTQNSKKIKKIVEIVKYMESKGYKYESADGSFFIIVKKTLKPLKPFFLLKSYKVSVEKDSLGNMVSSAMVKLDIRGKEEYAVAEGNGPVNALDNCLHKALSKYYPNIKEVRLTDFKVRVINGNAHTAAKVRVLIEASDSRKSWGTVGVNENIIDASWQALSDSIEYKLLK
jgi:2-isopropylmalate synthase